MSKKSEFARKAKENEAKIRTLSFLALDTSRAWRAIADKFNDAAARNIEDSVIHLSMQLNDLGASLISLFDESEQAIDEFRQNTQEFYNKLRNNPDLRDARYLPATKELDHLTKTLDNRRLQIQSLGFALNVN